MKCNRCGNEKPRNKYIKGISMCKDCLKEVIDSYETAVEVLKNNNQVINYELLNDIFFKEPYTELSYELFLEYLKCMTLPQNKIQKENDLIETLKNEEKKLLIKIENSMNKNEFGEYKNLIRCLTDVVKLRQEEEYKQPKLEQKYSHYTIKDSNNNDVEMISTWEQKGSIISNVKKYRVIQVPQLKIKIDEDNIIETDSGVSIPVLINNKMATYIKARKENNKYIIDK